MNTVCFPWQYNKTKSETAPPPPAPPAEGLASGFSEHLWTLHYARGLNDGLKQLGRMLYVPDELGTQDDVRAWLIEVQEWASAVGLPVECEGCPPLDWVSPPNPPSLLQTLFCGWSSGDGRYTSRDAFLDHRFMRCHRGYSLETEKAYRAGYYDLAKAFYEHFCCDDVLWKHAKDETRSLRRDMVWELKWELAFSMEFNEYSSFDLSPYRGAFDDRFKTVEGFSVPCLDHLGEQFAFIANARRSYWSVIGDIPAEGEIELGEDHPAVRLWLAFWAAEEFFGDVERDAKDCKSSTDFDMAVGDSDYARNAGWSEGFAAPWAKYNERFRIAVQGDWGACVRLASNASRLLERFKLRERCYRIHEKAIDDRRRQLYIERGGDPLGWPVFKVRHLNFRRVYALLDRIANHTLAKPAPVSEVRDGLSTDELKRYFALCRNELDKRAVADGSASDGAGTPSPVAGITDDLLEVPGLMQVYMDHCLRVAHTPNRALAFCGALALLSFLAARKFTDAQGTTPNIYLIAMAYSASGKDIPRKKNAEVLLRAGFGDCLGDRFGSAQGLEDALARNPQQLFQVDEIDSLLQAIAMGRDTLQLEKADFLLRVFSAANSVLPRRALAGSESRGMIENPSLTLFGTAVPDNVMQAITSKMIAGGLLGRSFLIDCNRPRVKQRAVSVPVPDELITAAKWLREFSPGGDLGGITGASPYVVPYTNEATAIFDKFTRLETDRYNAASDAGHKAIWGRAGELAAKLAMLYAVSVDYKKPIVGEAAATWATAFQLRQVERMLAMLDECECKTSFSADADRLLRMIQRQPDRKMEHSNCLKRSGSSGKEFGSIIGTLLDRGDITRFEVPTKGRPKVFYRAV